MKLAPIPGASVAAVNIGVAPLRLFRTTTFVSGMLPMLVIVPL